MNHICEYRQALYPDDPAASLDDLACNERAVGKINGKWYCAFHLDSVMESGTLVAVDVVCKACGQMFTKEMPKNYVDALMSLPDGFDGFTGTCPRCQSD